MSNLATAIAIAAGSFENKTDKAGKPYILHCLRVMNSVDQNDEELMIIAVLHDLIEDTHWNRSMLLSCGFSDRVLSALSLLTHDHKQSYDDYIKNIVFSPDARSVKLADLIDNSNITRLKGLTKKDFDRMEKYHKAYTYLSKT